MAYGIIKVDNITFDNGGSDQNVTVSGLYRATTSGVTVSGTIAAGTVSGVTVIGSTTVSGATVTGTTANFTSGNFSNLISAAATMSGALIMANQQQVQFREAVGNGVNHIALQAPAIVSADQTITLPDETGTVVTTGDNGSVTSTMILDGTILNADINASAAIADTKLATISTAGKVSGTAITSGTIDTSGELRITNASPGVRLTESDGTATHSQTVLVRSNDQFLIQTRDSTGTTAISNDYIIPSDASGATDHIWRIANTEKLSLDSAGLTVVNDLTISDKIIHAGDTDTAIRFPAANTVTVETNGLERLRVHSDGNVSIGSTNNTGDELYVNGTIRSNGQIQTLLGDTDTAPGYTWQGDEDTGMFRTGIDSLGFSAGGSEVARFNFGGTSGRRQLYFESTAEVWSASSLFLEGVSSVRSETIRDATTASASNVFINSVSGILQRSTSSVKYKTEIEDAELSYSEALVYGSRPVWYRSLSESDPSDYSYWGFIAEEVAEIDPRMVHWGDDGPEGVQYDRYVVHLVGVIQKQQQRLDALEARIAALEA
jgi:hypothetical protein